MENLGGLTVYSRFHFVFSGLGLFFSINYNKLTNGLGDLDMV